MGVCCDRSGWAEGLSEKSFFIDDVVNF